jgi:outer membrane biosynthesis protein TonB
LNKEKVKNMASKLSVTIAADTLEEAQALAYKFALGADDVGSAAVLGSQPEPEPKASKPEPKASEPEPEPEPAPEPDDGEETEEETEEEKKARKRKERARKAAETRRKNKEAKAAESKEEDSDADNVVELPPPKKANGGASSRVDIGPIKKISRLKALVIEFEKQGIETVDEMIDVLTEIKPELPYMKRLSEEDLPKRIKTAFNMVQDDRAG